MKIFYDQGECNLQIDNLKAKIKVLAKELQSDGFSKKVRDEIVNKVQKDAFRFKTGKRFRKLKPSTIERRKQLARYNKTDEHYQADKPNVTFTGRLLRSVKNRVNAKGSSIVMKIDVSGSHAPYKGKNGEIGKRKSNKEIRGYLADIGRDPLELSKKANRNLIRILTAIIKERLF